MPQLHIFNPSHDEALAAHSPYYYPSRAARQLGNDLATLPAWWAQAGDYVLIPDTLPLPASDFTGRDLHFLHPSSLRNLSPADIDSISPWGWDALLTHQLQRAGIPPTLLPSAGQLDTIRQLSSRQTAVHLLKAIRQEIPETTGTSSWCTDEHAVWNFVRRHGTAMLKAPWSSSGRGVFPATANAPESVHRRVTRLLREQGAVEAEPFYRHTTDLALEFTATATGVSYEGLSLFTTASTGAYTGNLIAPQDVLLQYLPAPLRPLLSPLADCLSHHLHRLLQGAYNGPLGVDLMCVDTPDGPRFHPCVEVNLRRTMGHVALHLRRTAGLTPAVYRLRPVAPSVPDIRVLTPGATVMEAVLDCRPCAFPPAG